MHEQDQSSESDEIELVWPKEQEKPTAAPRAQTGSPSRAKSEPATQEESVFLPARGREGPSGQPKRRKSRKSRRSRPDEVSARSLISALWYPATGGGIFVILLYALLLVGSSFLIFPILGFVVHLVLAAYVGLLFLETAAFTLAGMHQGPRLPELSWGNFTAGMYALVAVLIARIPVFVGHRVVANRLDLSEGTQTLIELLLTVAGLYYLPMAFLALAELESEEAWNPLVVLRGIGRMPLRYLAQVTAAGGVLIGLTGAVHWLPVPGLVRTLLGNLILLYVVVALMRAVALTFRRAGISLERA